MVDLIMFSPPYAETLDNSAKFWNKILNSGKPLIRRTGAKQYTNKWAEKWQPYSYNPANIGNLQYGEVNGSKA